MLKRKEEELNDNYYSNDNKISYGYGKLKRKMKNCDLNNIPVHNYFSNNNDYNNNLNYFNRNSKKLMKDSYCANTSKNSRNDIYTYYQYRNKNNNYDYNDNNNYNNRRANPIIRPSKSALAKRCSCDHSHSHHDNGITSKEKKEYLLCQNCINSRLIEQKKYRNELNKKSDAGIFEDKYKNYSQNLIREKINQREKNINEIYNNLEKWNELSDKDKLIKENENSINPLYQDNHNYLYEKFRTNYEKKQKMINDNYNKYQNLERPGITSYYKNYVNNPHCKEMGYGEYKPKKYDIDNYRRDLDEQINFRINKNRKEREEDKIRENIQSNYALKNLENEEKEKKLKKNRIKEELIKGNLELIEAKNKKKELLNYRDYYNRDKIKYNNDLLEEKAKKDKLKYEFVLENQKNLSRIRRKKEEQMLENEQYIYNDPSYEPPKEITAECSGCHRIYPKKLLTRNAYYFK